MINGGIAYRTSLEPAACYLSTGVTHQHFHWVRCLRTFHYVPRARAVITASAAAPTARVSVIAVSNGDLHMAFCATLPSSVETCPSCSRLPSPPPRAPVIEHRVHRTAPRRSELLAQDALSRVFGYLGQIKSLPVLGSARPRLTLTLRLAQTVSAVSRQWQAAAAVPGTWTGAQGPWSNATTAAVSGGRIHPCSPYQL